jgi:tetratricopeptide (TPR) repeat protein
MQVAESLGFASLAVKEYGEALENFEKAFAAGDDNPLMCLQLALLEGRAHQGQKVMAALQRALQAKPDYFEAQFEMGLFHLALREYQPAIDSFLSIKKVASARAAPVFASLAYAYFEVGDLDKARADALTAKQWARDSKQAANEDQLIAMIDARAKSPFAPQPGEKTERVNAILKAIECQPDSHRLVLDVDGKNLVLELPEIKAVEIAHNGSDKDLQLSCGPQSPQRLIVDYAPSAVVKASALGVIRRIEY